MSNAVAVVKEKLSANVDYKITLEPERTALTIEMFAEARDKIEKQGINQAETRDKLVQVEGISEKTRDNLMRMLEYIGMHPVVKNHEIAEMLEVGDDRARVLLMLLVDNGILVAKGDKKDRTYSLKESSK